MITTDMDIDGLENPRVEFFKNSTYEHHFTLTRAFMVLDSALKGHEELSNEFYELIGFEKIVGIDGDRDRKNAIEAAGPAAYQIAKRVDDEDVRSRLLDGLDNIQEIQSVKGRLVWDEDDEPKTESFGSSYDYTVPELPSESDEFYNKLANTVEEVVNRNDVEISDMEGHWVKERENEMYEFPVGLIENQLDTPDGLIFTGSRWTCPQMDWWASPIALVAISERFASVSEIQDYEHEETNNPWVQDSQRFWISNLSDDELIDLFVEARKTGISGDVPYNVLMAIAQKMDLRLNERGYLPFESRMRAKDMFEQLC